ncbi:MAG: cob(I)yrinic acid a,c-diamide adenosyltransferase [Candidatus Limivivens sp.]|nr:cob(I)yrinic acid a,c-diamide adenosyltransferase [Candidatus Limivivens sp.]
MDKGSVQIYFGAGKGKTTAAIGQAIKAASQGKTVFVIQFLKEKKEDEISFLARLEPEIKLFRFEKSTESYGNLSEDEQAEEIKNLLNGLNFAKKVLVTEECDVLVLDEVLGLMDYGIVTAEDLRGLINASNEGTRLIFTGSSPGKEIWDLADEVIELVPRKTEIDKTI